jgi:rhamnose transport system ATP-binding protein
VSSGAVSPSAAALSLVGIEKRFGGVRALSGVSLELRAGQVLALLGENGAGKSTAVKIMTGVYRPDAGSVTIAGEPVSLESPEVARQRGVAAVFQDALSFDDLSVAENLFMGHLATRRGGWLDWKSMRARAAAALRSLETELDLDTPLGALSVAQKHRVSIARALTHDARVLILDEPTAALSSREVDDLFRIIRRLASAGTALLFISHKLDEVFAIADRYSVLRDGRHVADGLVAEADEATLVRAMVGRAITQVFPKTTVELGAPLLEVRDLGNGTQFEGVSFTLHRGEVLGFYGLVGAGRTELVEALFGLTQPTHGEATLAGKPIGRSPGESIEHGLVLVPEDRQHHGTFPALSIRENVALPSLRRLGRGPFLDEAAEERLAQQVAERLAIKHASLGQSLSELSGGNQQKVVIGKWLATDPRVVILDEPTQGIDVGAKAAVHTFMGELVARGLGVILVSSELPEVMGVADRIVVMREGRVVRILARAEFDAKVIVTAALGAAQEDAALATQPDPAPGAGGIPPTESKDAAAARAS